MKEATIPAPPAGSTAAARRLWRGVLTEYALDAHELVLLRQAVATVDVCAALQAMVDRDGALVKNRFQELVAHPAVVELRQQRIVLARLIVALRVPLGEQEQHGGRLQRRGVRGVYGLGGVS